MIIILCVLPIHAKLTTISTLAGTGETVAVVSGQMTTVPATSAVFTTVNSVWGDDAGNIFISDSDGCKVRKWKPSDSKVYVTAGINAPGFTADNIPATSSALNGPQ